MVEDTSDQLTEDTIEMYQQFYRMAMDKLGESHSGVAVAGTMIGIALRLYRTAMDDTEYTSMMSYIFENHDLIEPFTVDEFESPTVH
jgi:peptide deformylase